MEQLQFGFGEPELDKAKTKAAVIAALEYYRMCKYLSFEDREAGTTAAYTERAHGPTNVTSDQTASIAIYNVEEPSRRQAYCERVERAVQRLPEIEQELINLRYMSNDADYITDLAVFNIKMNPPVSFPKYDKIRWRAFIKLAKALKIAVRKE